MMRYRQHLEGESDQRRAAEDGLLLGSGDAVGYLSTSFLERRGRPRTVRTAGAEELRLLRSPLALEVTFSPTVTVEESFALMEGAEANSVQQRHNSKDPKGLYKARNLNPHVSHYWYSTLNVFSFNPYNSVDGYSITPILKVRKAKLSKASGAAPSTQAVCSELLT